MALPKTFFLILLICLFSTVQSICVPRKTSHLSATPPSPSPESSSSSPETNSPASSPDADSPANSPGAESPGTNAFYPPIYYPPNGQPAESPAPQPDPSSPVSDPPTFHSKSPLSSSSRTPSIFSKFESYAINKICDTTDYPPVCVDTVKRFHANGKLDALAILGMAIEASKVELRKAKAAADKISSSFGNKISSGDDSDTGDSGPDVCKDSYSDAMEGLDSAVSAITGKDMGRVNSMLSGAITAFSDCADATSGEDSPLAPYNDMLKKLVSNSLAVASLIH